MYGTQFSDYIVMLHLIDTYARGDEVDTQIDNVLEIVTTTNVRITLQCLKQELYPTNDKLLDILQTSIGNEKTLDFEAQR